MAATESVLFRNWKPACTTAWINFIVYEVAIGYDKFYSVNPLCHHSDRHYPIWYWYICHGVLGAFTITLLLIITKISQVDTIEDKVPHLVACNIILISAIATVLSLVGWGGICIDVLGVASPAAIWGSWIATGPLIIFVVVSLDNKLRLDRMDWMLMGTFFLCLIAGFFIIIPTSVALGTFWLVVSCTAYVPSIFLPCYCNPNLSYAVLVGRSTAATEDQALMQVSHMQRTLYRRYQLSWALTIILPFHTVTYLVAYGGMITPAETIAIYHILSVLLKGFFASITMDTHFELREAYRRAETESRRVNEARRAFLKYIFHELRSPLNSLSIGIDLLQSSGALQGNDVESVVLMKDASVFMTDILNNVLTIQKIEEGKLELDMAAFSIRAAIYRVSAVLRAAVLQKRIRMVVNCSPAVPELVLGDRCRIEHVIGNLLSNAIKFSPENSEIVVEVSVETERICFEAGNSRTVSVILLSVLDAGPGISPNDQTRLFQNFVQIRPGQLQKGAGSGLGLTIAKQIVELHGGRIGVTSMEGHGSLFYFSIPFQQVDVDSLNPAPLEGFSSPFGELCDSTHEEIKDSFSVATLPLSDSRLAVPLTSSLRVLVVDDSASILKMMKMLLKKFGVEADTAENGRAAVDMISLSPDPYQLVLMDNLMPEMNGLEATRLLRRQGFDGLIVGVTGHVFEEDVAAFLDAGADLVLAKPLAMNTVQMLLTCIAENISLGSVTLTRPSGTGSRLQVEQKRRLLIDLEDSLPVIRSRARG